MTDPIYDYDYLDDVRDVYRQVVAESDPDEGTPISEAREIAIDRLRPMVASGELKLPADDLLRAAINQVDKADGDRGDVALRRIVAGQGSLDLGDADPFLQTVARIGGRRKPWSRITRTDLVMLDDQRYQNLKRAQDAYANWRPIYQRGFNALNEHSTLGDAFDSGAFDD